MKKMDKDEYKERMTRFFTVFRMTIKTEFIPNPLDQIWRPYSMTPFNYRAGILPPAIAYVSSIGGQVRLSP